MSLRDPERADAAFAVDEVVKRTLEAWGKARDADAGRRGLGEAMDVLSEGQASQLRQRLAEISLGMLFVLEHGPQKKKPARRRR
ncbi:MAG: hypothetical protein HYV07_13415 [Deltaproteobacteria bacterium]|nr:hypothetical protein [Deltaproteobacteria bacterium]